MPSVACEVSYVGDERGLLVSCLSLLDHSVLVTLTFVSCYEVESLELEVKESWSG